MNANLVEVGKATRFQKGRSGNPGGARKTKPLTDAILKELAIMPHGQQHVTNLQLVADKVVQRAKAGDMLAVRLIWEYLEGKPVQREEHSGPDGTAIEFTLSILKTDNGNSDRAG